MKIIPFTIPVKEGESISTNHEILTQFYPYYHQHNELQIIYIVRGKGSLLFDNRLFEFKPDSCLILGANQAHVFKNDPMPDEFSSIETYNIFIDFKSKLKELFRLPEFEEMKMWLDLIGLATIETEFLPEVKNKIKFILEKQGSKRIIELMSLFDYLMPKSFDLAARSDRVFSENDGSRLNLVIQYIWDHFAEELSLSDCAKYINMQPESFSRFFKKRTNSNFSKYLNEVRIHQACKLLHTESDIPISEVAYRCGFNHVTHFNRVFKSIAERSPLKYRRELLHIK